MERDQLRTIMSLNPADVLGFAAEIAVVSPTDALRERAKGKTGGIRRARRRPPAD